MKTNSYILFFEDFVVYISMEFIIGFCKLIMILMVWENPLKWNVWLSKLELLPVLVFGLENLG